VRSPGTTSAVGDADGVADAAGVAGADVVGAVVVCGVAVAGAARGWRPVARYLDARYPAQDRPDSGTCRGRHGERDREQRDGRERSDRDAWQPVSPRPQRRTAAVARRCRGGPQPVPHRGREVGRLGEVEVRGQPAQPVSRVAS
jgi:hypothetical protein